MTTGEAIAESLVAHGVDTVFGIPGVHMYDFNDALARRSDKIRFITTRHEQAAGYMAYGYAKSTGRVGAYTVVPGPGVFIPPPRCVPPMARSRRCCASPATSCRT